MALFAMWGMPDYKNYSKDRTKKLCFQCRDMIDIEQFRIKEKKHGRSKGKYRNNICITCEGHKVAEYRRTDRGIAAEIARRTKSKCKKLILPYDLDKDWILDKLNTIEWKCELTRLPMNLRTETRSGFQWDSISTDRINPKGGYTKDNVRFILNQVNVFRQDHPDDQMYMIAKALLDRKKENEQAKISSDSG